MKIKYPIGKHNYKDKEMRDESKILKAEIQQLEEEIEWVIKENSKRQRVYEEIDKGNQEINDKAQKLKNNLKEEKDIVSEIEKYKKQNELQYEEQMKELRKIDGEYRRLVERRIQLEHPKKETDESEFEKEDKSIVEVTKQKIKKRIASNKAKQLKLKVKAQKKKNDDLDKEIDEVKNTIKDKMEKNEEISKRSKELRGMIMVRNNRSMMGGRRPPSSPKEHELDKKAEL